MAVGPPRRSRSPVLLAAFLLVLVSASALQARAQESQLAATQQQVESAFALVQSAAASGGNVTSLLATLNQAAQLVIQSQETQNSTKAAADLARASSIAQAVSASAPQVGAQGAASTRSGEEAAGVELAAVAAVCLLLYVYLPRAYWRLWVRAHADWRIEKP